MKGAQEGLWNQEAYLVFPVHLDGTLSDNLNTLQAQGQFFPTITVLHIFRQVESWPVINLFPGFVRRSMRNLSIRESLLMNLSSTYVEHEEVEVRTFVRSFILSSCVGQICAGLKHMHTGDTPYAHNDLKPANVLLSKRKDQPPQVIIMDFGSATVARKQIRSRSQALALQVGLFSNFESSDFFNLESLQHYR